MMNDKKDNRVRKTAFIAVFGALWGLSEITLGSVLHSFQIPLTGMVMTALSIIIAVTGSLFIRSFGAITLMGMIASFMKLFSLGGIILTPVIAILIEAVILDILTWAGKRTFVSICLAGGTTLLYAFLHKFTIGAFIYGLEFFQVLKDTMLLLSEDFNINEKLGWYFFGFIGLIHVVTGIISGAVSWLAYRKIKSRLNYDE